MFQGVEHIQHTIDAIGTTVAGKSIGLIGMTTAMREKVEGAKTSGVITVTLVLSLIAGVFAFAGMAYMAQGTREDTRRQLARMEKVQSETKTEMNAQLSAIMDNATANLALIAGTFKDQLELSQKLFKSELEKRDIKLDIAYKSANKGSRYTGEQAQDHEDEDLAHQLQSDQRYYESRERFNKIEHNCQETKSKVETLEALCTETRKRVLAVEGEHKGL